MDKSQNNYAEWKKPNKKDILCGFIYLKTLENEN